MRLIALMLVVVAFAGCASDSTPTPPDVPPPAAGTGVIRGVVVDTAIMTLAGAHIELMGSDKTAESDAEGRFELRDVEPGSRTLYVTRKGFEPVQYGTTVVADVASPKVVQVMMAPDPSFIELAVTEKWEGFMNCQVGWNAGTGLLPGVDRNALNPCTALNFAIEDTDRITKEYEYDSTPTYSQSELVWIPSQTLAGFMSVMYTYTGDGGLDNYARASGESPLVIGANQTLLATKKVGIDEPLLVRVFASSEDPYTLIAQQPFEVFTTKFLGFEPSEGWMYSVHGPAEPPA